MSNKNKTNIFDGSTILHGEEMVVSHGVVANRISVGSGGRLVVARGGIANDTSVSSNGHLIVYAGGTVNRTLIGPDAVLILRYGARAFDTTIDKNGFFSILRDGFASNISVLSGGILSVSCGVATGINAAKGARIGIWLSKYSHIQGTSNGSSFDMKDGFVSDYTIDSGNGLTLLDQYKADKIVVKPYGDLCVGSGGHVTNLTVEEGGFVSFDFTSNTYLQGSSNGSAFEIKDPILTSHTLNGEMIKIYDGGIANEIQVNGPEDGNDEDKQGYLEVGDDAMVNKLIISGGMVSIDGGIVNKTDISCGQIDISNGEVHSIHVEKGAVEISDGGTINYSTNFGKQTIGSGGTIVNNRICGGNVEIKNCGVAVETTLFNGKLIVSSGGTALSIDKWGGEIEILDGAVVLNVDNKE